MSTPISFTKGHGTGNDFVIVDDRDGALSHTGALERDTRAAMADRRRGIGCDQLLVLGKPSNGAGDVFMRVYNPDGGEVEACGNGTRCVAALVMGEGGKDTLGVETVAGILASTRNADGTVSVDMGEPRLEWDQIPLAREMDTLSVDMAYIPYTDPVAVNMGNPHVVFFVDDAEAVPLEECGPVLENDPLLLQRANIEFVEKKADGSLRMRVWERGCGITLACGSGASAVGVAAYRAGLSGRVSDIVMDGGMVTIDWQDDGTDSGRVIMQGPVAYVCQGHLSDELDQCLRAV
ncbi:diaminopimelate epimerase [uncultured Microbacterium sp.]|uniref:diaminopimelate epimerase n=1 Tax=uncultured Microbacterium sp. TaxID=191216 RepID=UPI0025E6CE0E|nr:diaminopimelate epimerase [uncultured Microbacterium sp.]